MSLKQYMVLIMLIVEKLTEVDPNMAKLCSATVVRAGKTVTVWSQITGHSVASCCPLSYHLSCCSLQRTIYNNLISLREAIVLLTGLKIFILMERSQNRPLVQVWTVVCHLVMPEQSRTGLTFSKYVSVLTFTQTKCSTVFLLLLMMFPLLHALLPAEII